MTTCKRHATCPFLWPQHQATISRSSLCARPCFLTNLFVPQVPTIVPQVPIGDEHRCSATQIAHRACRTAVADFCRDVIQILGIDLLKVATQALLAPPRINGNGGGRGNPKMRICIWMTQLLPCNFAGAATATARPSSLVLGSRRPVVLTRRRPLCWTWWPERVGRFGDHGHGALHHTGMSWHLDANHWPQRFGDQWNHSMRRRHCRRYAAHITRPRVRRRRARRLQY